MWWSIDSWNSRAVTSLFWSRFLPKCCLVRSVCTLSTVLRRGSKHFCISIVTVLLYVWYKASSKHPIGYSVLYFPSYTCTSISVEYGKFSVKNYIPTLVIRTSIIWTQFRTWSLFTKMVFSLKSQALQLSRVHVFVCHTYMFNVDTRLYVIVYSVKCKGLQTRPSYIFYVTILCI